MNLSEIDELIKEIEENNFTVNLRGYTGFQNKQKVLKAYQSFNFNPVTIEEVKENLGRKYKICVNRIFNLISFLSRGKFYVEKEPVAISVQLYKFIKNERGERIFKSAPIIQKTLEDMKAIGCLKCIDERYACAAGKPKIYLINDIRINSLFSLFDLNTLTFGYKEKVSNVNDDLNNNNDNMYEEEDDENKDVKREYNPEVEKLKDLLKPLIREQNKNTKGIYKYSLTGLRPSAPICYVASKEKAALHRKEHSIYREDIIQKDFGDLKEFDRNASIYRLMYSIGHNGEVQSNNRQESDFYKEILNTLTFGYKEKVNELNLSLNDISNVSKYVRDSKCNVEYTPQLRNAVKTLMMTIYFATEKQIKALSEDFVNFFVNRDLTCRPKFYKFANRVKAVHEIFGIDIKKDNNGLDLLMFLQSFFRVAKVLLKNYLNYDINDRSIFLKEAIVNLSVEQKLKEEGFTCVSVYDGFYTNAEENKWFEIYCSKVKVLNNILKEEI